MASADVGASATKGGVARAEPPCSFANGSVDCDARQDIDGDSIDRLISAASSLANLEAYESDFEGTAAPSSCNKDSASEREQGSLPVSNGSWDLIVPSLPTIDVVNQENLLRSASLSLIEPQQKLPWEEGFWGNFFDHSTPLDECLPPPHTFRPSPCLLQRDIPLVEERVAKKAKTSDSVPIFCQVVKSRALTSWQDKREAEHQRALKKWAYLFEVWDPEVDPKIKDVADVPPDKRLLLLDSCMARKAPSTMLKRAASLVRITKAAEAKGLLFPLPEAELFSLLLEAKAGGAVLSQLRGIMEAITFARFVFGLRSLQELCDSRKCWGLAAAKVAMMPSRASPLRVEDLEKLHSILRDAKDSWDSLFAGCVLFCAYGRARWSDAQHCGEFSLDRDPQTGRCVYLEAVVAVHKTVNLRGSNPVCLELVSPGYGVTDDDWISQFMEARSRLNLDKEFCFIPRFQRESHCESP